MTALSGATEALIEPKQTPRRFGLAIRLAPVVGLGAIVLLLFTGFNAASKPEALRGHVAPTASLSHVLTSVGGTVKQVHVRSGQAVAAGQTLFTIQIQAGAAASDAAHQALRERKLAAVESRKAARNAADAAAQENAQVAAIMATVIREVELQERDLQGALSRQQDLVKKARLYLASGYTTRDVVLAQERTAFEYSRQLSDARVKKVEFLQQGGERGRAQQALARQQQAQIATLDGEIASLDARLAQPRSAAVQEIAAPTGGRVEALLVEAGAAISAQQPVALFAASRTDSSIVLEAPVARRE